MFSVLLFIVVLGVLVFFHELGHFLAAKACGIYCDRFSLGMPPRIFGLRLGETDYCIGALPIGGYVKMAGQEDSPMSEEERDKDYGHVPPERWFNNKPVWQRVIVIAAGPLMNLVLGIVLYGFIAALGAEVPETKVDNRIGYVLPDSPASRAPMYKVGSPDEVPDLTKDADTTGWQTGDRLVSINGTKVDNIGGVAVKAILGVGEVLKVRIERTLPDGETAHYFSPVEPKTIDEDDEHTRFGILPFQTALIDTVFEDQPAGKCGLRAGDVIVRANGAVVDSSAFAKMVQGLKEGESLRIEVDRAGEPVELTLQPEIVGRFTNVSFSPPLYGGKQEDESARPTITFVSPDIKGEAAPHKHDVVTEIDGQPATVALLRETQRTKPNEEIALKVERPALMFGLIQKASTLEVKVKPEAVGNIGVLFGEKRVFHRVPPMQVVPEAFRQGYNALAVTVETLEKLLTGAVSAKNMGGPILIFQSTTAAAKEGFTWLVEMTAFISVNLCVFNLLPLPVLDGGLLAMLGWEGIRRKPVDPKVAERIQKVGLVLIIGLLLFVTYNDLMRLITSNYF